MYNFKKACAAIAAVAVSAGTLAAFPDSSVQQLSAETAYVTNDFDTEYEGWCNVGDLTKLTADEQNPHNGTRSMCVSNRLTPEDGASSAKGLWLWGGRNYNYSVFVKHSSGNLENFRLSMSYLLADGETWEDTVIAEGSASSGQWTELKGKFRAPEGASEFIVKITTDSTCDFWFDDFTVEGKKYSSSNVSAAGSGLKDEFANYFRVGNILNGGTVKNSTITAEYLKDFNSIECENETKPDATLVKNGSTDTNINVSLNSCAAIADWCSKNGMGFRGHTLVWHSQTPQWFFKQGFNDSGAWVSKDVMNQRLESYIKNMFNAFKTQYPNLNIYAYDVANECMNDSNGGPRTGGYGNGASPWTQIYGDNSFIEQAFRIARKYAPEGCDLYYNDYNEYMANGKKQAIMALAKDLYGKGLLDGVGMQSHVPANATGFAGTVDYLQAMDDYLAIGCDVQVTELDISLENGKYSLQDQATKYKAIYQHAVDHNKANKAGQGKVTLVQVWGPNDANSWLKAGSNALLFDSNHQPKLAYNELIKLLPQSEWGDGNNPVYGGSGEPAKPMEPDSNGYYYYYDMESDLSAFEARGGCTIGPSGRFPYKGSEALVISERSDAWNGAQLPLSTTTFVPGSEYSFSACYAELDGPDECEFKMTLQYELDGETHYDQIALETTANGNYVQLANPNFKIPSGASNLYVVFETTEETCNFYIDEVIIAKAGTKIDGPSAIKSSSVRGDLDGDEKITIADLVIIKNGLLNGFRSTAERKNADVDKSREVNASDALYLQEYLLGKISEFPDNTPAISIDVEKLEAAFAGTKLAESWKKVGENNPLTTQRFGADPGWMVYKDRLYIYTTNDAFEYRADGSIQENTYASGTINCVSTADMVNWTDHGAIPVAKTNTQNPITKWANNAWAPDAAWKNINGKDQFFLYFANNGSGIGVITADKPTFQNAKDPIGKELISRSTPNSNVTWLFDPGVYYDEASGEAYIAFGGGVPSGQAALTKQGRIAKLGDDMISIVGTPIAPGTPYLFEDSSMIKIGNEWVYSFCHNWNVPGGATQNGQSFSSADIGYMTSANGLGPYTYKGVVFKNTGSQRLDNGGNNHHSIVSFKNKLYVAYHTRQQAIRMVSGLGLNITNSNGQKSADGNYRSTCIDECTNTNGKLYCAGSLQGVSQIETLNPYNRVQAETMQNQAGISISGWGGDAPVVTNTNKGDWIKVQGVKFDKGATTLTARVGSKNGGAIKVATSQTGSAVAYIDVPAGGLTEVEMPVIGELSGTTDLYFIFTDGVEFDWWQFS